MKNRIIPLTILALGTLTLVLFTNVLGEHKSVEADKEIEVSEEIEVDKEIKEKIFESHTLIPVLMYHHFVEVGEETSYTTITNEAFEEQVTYLKSKGYNTITDQDLVDYYYNGKELPENPIHIMIDDGYESNYKYAYPVLKENDMKATIFIIVSRFDEEYGLPRLSWEQVKEMSDSEVISIQSHTYDLHHKENIDAVEVSAMIADDSDVYYQKIIDDLTISKQLIEYKLDKEVISLSYPYGHYDENTLTAVEDVGFKVAYTVEHGLNGLDTNPLELQRINVSPGWTGETIEKEIIKLGTIKLTK